MTKVLGCGAQTHLFGHSHVNVDLLINDVRFVQHALGYPQHSLFHVAVLRLLHRLPTSVAGHPNDDPEAKKWERFVPSLLWTRCCVP